MFTDEQKKALQAKLDPSAVKDRKQGGAKVFYIEGWHAIAEANRIFGFDAWTRETVDIRCVSERERKIGQHPNQRDGWGVSYVAKVRITVGGVVREGVGAGHGVDADLGAAHESAIKEAETDAMKRALSTFGNPFGLALYDKSKANVGREEHDPDTGELPPVDHAGTRDEIVRLLNACKTLEDLRELWKAEWVQSFMHQAPRDMANALTRFKDDRKAALMKEAA